MQLHNCSRHRNGPQPYGSPCMTSSFGPASLTADVIYGCPLMRPPPNVPTRQPLPPPAPFRIHGSVDQPIRQTRECIFGPSPFLSFTPSLRRFLHSSSSSSSDAPNDTSRGQRGRLESGPRARICLSVAQKLGAAHFN